MNSLKVSAIVGALLVFGAAGACSSKVSQGGSETNWLCSTDANCTVGQTCVERRCKPRNESNMAIGAADGGRAATQTTTEFADVIKVPPDTCGSNPECLKGACLPMGVKRDVNGNVACSVMDVTTPYGNDCSAPGHSLPELHRLIATLDVLRQRGICDAAGVPACTDLRICALTEIADPNCLIDAPLPAGAAGWCYVDPATDPSADPALVSNCRADEQRMIRLSPLGPEARTIVIACTDVRAGASTTPGTPGRIGEGCILGDEYNPNFSGYSTTEVNIESGTPQCDTGLCLGATFSGRASCPYGQPPDPTNPNVVDPAAQTCFTPDGAPVTVPVPPQKRVRTPSDAVYCSCLCDGSGAPSSYCACPSGFECAPLVSNYGFGTTVLAGSYCVKTGTQPFDPDNPGPDCNRAALDCGPVRP